MNGRIYDPTLGRFLQADPFIQAPGNSQSYNRYSYIMNNPLSGTDPSGFISLSKILSPLLRPIIKVSVKIFGAELTNIIGSAIFGKLMGPFGVGYWSYNFNRAIGGSSSSALRGAFTATAAAIAFQQIGAKFNGPDGSWYAEGSIAHIAAHAVTGGVIAELQGGKFGHGFFSAGVAKGLGPYINGIGGDTFVVSDINVAEVVVTAVVGGTVSKITGGKFSNGAYTAAMGNLFNKQGLLDRVVDDFKEFFRAKKSKAGDAIDAADSAKSLLPGSEFRNPDRHEHAWANACSNNAAYRECDARASEWQEALHVDAIAKSPQGQFVEKIFGNIGRDYVCRVYCEKVKYDANGKYLPPPLLDHYIPPVPQTLQTIADPMGSLWDQFEGQ